MFGLGHGCCCAHARVWLLLECVVLSVVELPAGQSVSGCCGSSCFEFSVGLSEVMRQSPQPVAQLLFGSACAGTVANPASCAHGTVPVTVHSTTQPAQQLGTHVWSMRAGQGWQSHDEHAAMVAASTVALSQPVSKSQRIGVPHICAVSAIDRCQTPMPDIVGHRRCPASQSRVRGTADIGRNVCGVCYRCRHGPNF